MPMLNQILTSPRRFPRPRSPVGASEEAFQAPLFDEFVETSVGQWMARRRRRSFYRWFGPLSFVSRLEQVLVAN